MGTPFTQGLISSTGITQLYAKIKPCMRVQAETKPLGELLTARGRYASHGILYSSHIIHGMQYSNLYDI